MGLYADGVRVWALGVIAEEEAQTAQARATAENITRAGFAVMGVSDPEDSLDNLAQIILRACELAADERFQEIQTRVADLERRLHIR